jgi:hypothetical protein
MVNAHRTPEQLLSELQRRIDAGEVKNAKQADEAAAELVGDSGFGLNTAEYDDLLAKLCEVAGQEFPGDWADYPKN